MALSDPIKHPIPELKGNWIEPKLAGILGDSRRAMQVHLESNLGAAMGKSASQDKIGATVEMLQGLVNDAVTEAVSFTHKHGIRVDESVRPPALALSQSGKDRWESALSQIDESAAPVVRKALKAGLQAALKGIQNAQAEKLGIPAQAAPSR